MSFNELLGEMPMPGRRPRIRRSVEIEAAIVEGARQGYPIRVIAGALGIPAATVHGWTRRSGTFGPQLRAAIEEGRRLNTDVDRARFMAGAQRLRSLLPRRG